jgi:hypothetical protein
MITPLEQPMDPLDNMTPEEAKALEDWEDHFKVTMLGNLLIADQVYSSWSIGGTRPETWRGRLAINW